MAVVDDLGQPDTESPAPAEEFGRQPPQDLAAEQSVLGGMLLSKDAIADVLEADHGWSFEQSDAWLERMGLWAEEF